MPRSVVRSEIPIDRGWHDIEMTGTPVAAHARLDVVDIWWEQNDLLPRAVSSFRVYGDGHQLPPKARYVATTPPDTDGRAWHIYRLARPHESPWHPSKEEQ